MKKYALWWEKIPEKNRFYIKKVFLSNKAIESGISSWKPLHPKFKLS